MRRQSMKYYSNKSYNNQNNNVPPQSDSEKTRKELNAKRQLGKFDVHFNNPDTTVRLDATTSSLNGKKKRRYIVSQNGEEKYTAKFTEKNGKQELKQVVSIKYTKKKIKPSSKKK